MLKAKNETLVAFKKFRALRKKKLKFLEQIEVENSVQESLMFTVKKLVF